MSRGIFHKPENPVDGEGNQQEKNDKREGGGETGGKPQSSPSEGEPQDAGGGGGGGDGGGGGGGGRGSTSDGADQPPPSRSVPPPSPLSASSEPRKLALRTQLAHQLSANSTKQLRKPTHVVRPTPPPPHAVPVTNPILDVTAVVQVFRFLPVEDLGRCAAVCRAWSRAAIDPLLWRRTDLSRRHLSGALLAGIVRRQPEALHLDWTSPPPAKRHLAWLIARLPQLRELSLQGCSWAGASALRSCTCPPLSVLDLSFVMGLNDASLRELLSPPPDSRPGLVGSRSRLKGLRTLRLAGCDISDVALRYITQHLPKLVELDISQCVRVTDAGVAQLAAPPAATTSTLAHLDLSSCRLLTDSSLDHLARCDGVVRLDMRHTPNVTAAALAKFAVRSRHGLHVTDTKLIVKKRTPSPEKTST